ncbi:hypothetical protein NFI96_006046 [Prochilodus magdalenae]|nr:hypothetical protein NFI96_006046 [Prochilodus magdalenae]
MLPVVLQPNPLTAASLAQACLSPASASTLRFSIYDISIRNAWVDGRRVFSAEYHFDDESFEKARRLITQGVSDVKTSLKQKNYMYARQRLGETMHTLQDFYSHSNWIELGNRSPYSTLITPSQPFENLADVSTPTCRSCDIDCTNNILEPIITQKKLTSGYFSLTSSKKPAGGRTPGGLVQKEPPLYQRKEDEGDDCGLPLHVGGSAVEVVSSYRYLGVHLSNNLTWSNNTSSLVRKAHQQLYFLRGLRRAGLGSPVLTSFYRCVVESVLCSSISAWHGSCSAADRKALQRVVKAAQRSVGVSLPTTTDIYTSRCRKRATCIMKDPTHPAHSLFVPVPSGRRLRSGKCKTSRLRSSFIPEAVRLLNAT